MSSTEQKFHIELIDRAANEVVTLIKPAQPEWFEVVLYDGKVYAYAWSVEGKGWCYQEATSVQWDDLMRN